MPEIEVADVSAIIRFAGRYAWASNFYQKPFKWRGYTWPGGEWAYQWSKNPTARFAAEMLEADSALEAKRLGRHTTAQPNWEMRKDADMWDMLKFGKFNRLKQVMAKNLRDTGDAVLVEGNHWHDNYWGVCYCGSCPGEGQNMLGRLLMVVRADLIALA